MAVNKANVRANRIYVSVAGSEFHLSKATIEIGGEKIPIFSANLGEEIGALQGMRNFDFEVVFLESAPAVVRELVGVDSAGLDNVPDVGTAVPTVRVNFWDPADTNKLACINVLAASLLTLKLDRDGKGPATLIGKFRAYRDDSGNIVAIGPPA